MGVTKQSNLVILICEYPPKRVYLVGERRWRLRDTGRALYTCFCHCRFPRRGVGKLEGYDLLLAEYEVDCLQLQQSGACQ